MRRGNSPETSAADAGAMTHRKNARQAGLKSGVAALALILAVPAWGQVANGPPAADQAAPVSDDDMASDDIVVTGQALPGSVIGDIPPERQLGPRDIRAYGVGTIAELLNELAPQTTSGQGRGDDAPVILVNGRRISGVNEVRDLPTESILRLDILPEEVALKYGYTAEQKVVNVILRRRFASLVGNAGFGMSGEGQNERTRADATLTRIRGNDRLNVALSAQRQASITEAERGVVAQNGSPGSDPAFRTLQPARQTYSLNASYATAFSRSLSASANVSATHSLANALNGLSGDDPLDQRTRSDAVRIGAVLNADLTRSWRLSLTAGYDRTTTVTDTERFADPGTGAPAADRARSTSNALDGSALLTGEILKLPAGGLRTSVLLGVSTSDYTSATTGTRIVAARTLARSTGRARVSVDLPLTRRGGWGGAIGSLTANANMSATDISDFGTLTTFGYGLNWSPTTAISVVAAINQDRRAPTVQQLNDPVVTVANVPIFDVATGQSVLATRVTGGNPLLAADDRRTFKLGAAVRPFADADLTFTANYSRSTARNAILSLAGISPQVEAAFPDRFERDLNGALESFDTRAVNVASQQRANLRWGFSFTQVLRASKRPEPNGRPRRAGGGRPMGADAPGDEAPALPMTDNAPGTDEVGQGGGDIVVTGQRQTDVEPPGVPGRGMGRRPGGNGGRRGGAFGGGNRAPGAGGGPGGGGGGPGGMGGFGRGGGMRGADDGARLQLSIYHSWLFENLVTLRDGLVPIDLLNGGTLGGPPPSRHQVQVNGGVTDNGVGVRLTGQWRSAARTDGQGAPTGALRFGSLATFDIRLFADLGQRFPTTKWAGGMRVSLSLQNVLNERQRVTYTTGATPLAYQPALLDPVGRAALLTIRKLF